MIHSISMRCLRKLYEDAAEDEGENLDELRSYLVLAEADERKRIAAMGFNRSVTDFTQEEIERFDHMQEVLTESFG